MNRRMFLATTSTAIAGAVAGCLSEFAPGSDGDGADRGYEMAEFSDQTVPLAPIDDVYEWYDAGEVKIVDARTEARYETAHIEGAVLSPVDADEIDDDPVAVWSTDTRIVTYCDCPHSLAVQRAAALKDDGYENVYALDEGFPEWQSREYPVSEGDTQASISTHLIEGQTTTDAAGEYVWLSDPETGLIEYGPVAEDGRFELTPRAVDVDDEGTLVIETPGGSHQGTLDELTSDVVRI